MGGHASRRPWRCAAIFGAGSLAVMAGCYDSGALLEAKHEETNVAKLAEVDLGAFRVTLPQATGEAGGGVVDFQAFGRVARSDQAAVAAALEERKAELRSQMLLKLRAVTAAELEEPNLDMLRAQIAEVINHALDKKHIKNVGFYRFAYTSL